MPALFLPCAGGVETLLADECASILGRPHGIEAARGGVVVHGDVADAMRLNLHSRLAQRVLWPLAHAGYRNEHDLYDLARRLDWREWLTPQQTFRIDTTAQRSPLLSLNFATLRVKDGLLLDYLRYLSHSDYFQMTCFHASVGVAIEKMVFRLEEWLNHKFHLPPEAEQRRIASCVGWLEHEIVLLSKQRDAVTKQKRGLMQLLLTGKLRVRTQ